MADVFISYARPDERDAQRIAERLGALGYAVWRDTELPAHRPYAEVIEERLRAARAVVVVWSANAARSQWVRAEADLARQAGTLVQLSVDGAPLPLPFNQIQYADLAGWAGDATAPGWRKVIGSLDALLGAPAAAPAPAAPRRAEPRAPLLAVLAFDNLSGDAGMDYFSDGVSEEILETVLRTSDLKVIARSSSFQFRGADKAARRVSAALNVTHLLDGSIRRSGARVRISVQLVDCASETTVWSQRYDREMSDVFALQDEIAEAVADALKAAFAQSENIQPVDPAAYDLYLRARVLSADQDAAPRIALLEKAVALAPDFAAAWAALCHARAVQARNGPRPQPYEVLRTGVVSAAETALRLNPNAGLAYASLSRLEAFASYQAREALLRRGLTVAENQTETIAPMASFCLNVGFVQEGLGLAGRAYELDPLYPEAADVYGAALSRAGRYAEALAHYDIFRARWPEQSVYIFGPMNYAVFAGDWALFDRLAKTARDSGLDDPSIAASLRFGEGVRSQDPEQRDRMAQRLLRFSGAEAAPLHILVTAMRMGLKEEVFATLERTAYDFMFEDGGPLPAAEHSQSLIFDPAYNAEMMKDVRFVSLCAKLGLCDYWTAADRWPDCADTLAKHYDFKAEARRLSKA